jgi:hypothetical protein
LEGSEAGKVARYSRLTPPFCLYEDRWLEVDSVRDGSPPTYLRTRS